MNKIVVDLAQFRASQSAGQMSGRNSERETPVARSIGKTNSAGTPFLDSLSQNQTCCCVVPIWRARGDWPPASWHARFNASVDDMAGHYPNLGGLQPKNLWDSTNLKFGSVGSMNGPIDPIALGRRIKERRVELGMSTGEVGAPLRKRGLRGYSQQNIVTLEKGATKDPRRQAMDLAETLYTTTEWLLYGTGVRSTGSPVMNGNQFEQLPFELRQEITALAKERMAKKKRA